MALPPIETLIARAKRAWGHTRSWYGLYSEAAYYADPSVLPYNEASGSRSHASRGSPRHDHLFDGTLMRAKEKLALKLVSRIFPTGKNWADVTRGTMMLGADQGERRQNEAALALSRKIFGAIHASNFTKSVTMLSREGVTFGTGIMKAGMQRGSQTAVEFTAVPQAQVAMEAGPNESVWGFHRKGEMELDFIRALWPDAANLPEERARPGQLPTQWPIQESTIFDPDDGMWYVVVLVEDAGSGGGTGYRQVLEEPYHVCPWIAYRYSLRPNEVRGRGPVFECLPDARSANKAMQTQLESASMRVAGMFTYRADSVFNPRVARLRSGAFLQVGSNDQANPTIRPLDITGDVRFGMEMLERFQTTINEGCNVTPQPPLTGQVRSATEWLQHQANEIETLGLPALAMVEEVARPVLRLVAYLLAEQKQLPELAAFLPANEDGTPAPLKLDGTDFEVSFTGPQAQAQRVQDLGNMAQFAEIVMRTYGPQALMTATSPEEFVAQAAEKTQIPPGIVRPLEERRELGGQAIEGMIAANQPAAAPQQGAA